MTVNTTDFIEGHNGPGAGPFPVTWRFITPTDLRVTRIAVGGARTALTIGTHYTVAGNWTTNGGSVTLLSALLTGEQVEIQRSTDLFQTLVYQQSSRFPAAAHERALDKLTMIDQETRAIADAASAAVSQVVSLVAQHTSQIGALQAAVTAATSTLAAVQSAVNTNTSAIALLNTSQTTQNNQIAAIEGRLDALDDAPQIIDINYEPSSGITPTTVVSFSASVVSALPILEWGWLFYGAGGVFLGSSSQAVPVRPGAYQASVRARNATGWSPILGISIPVSGGSAAPDVIDISTGGAFVVGSPINFTAINVGGAIAAYSWSFFIDNVSVDASLEVSPTKAFGFAGLLRADVTVTGPGGSDTYSENLGSINFVAPDITDLTFSPTSGWTTATPITITPTNVGGPVSTYAWVFRIDGSSIGTSSAAVPTYTFTTAGVASAEVTVTGPGGGDFYSETIGTITGGGATNRIVDHLGNRLVDHLGNFIAHA